jgi:hypothetical protein
VQDSTNLWEAWKLSKAYRTRPSEIYGLRDDVEAWCFDRAVFLFGSHLEYELREAADGAKTKAKAQQKQQMVLDRWLSDPDQPRRFKDPLASAETSSGSSGPVSL